jgi:hypothetical protein
MAQCMAMGQAAGSAAAVAVSRQIAPRDVPPAELRENLRKLGAVLETP